MKGSSVKRGVLDTLDLIFEHQLAALEFDNLEVVGRKMLESIVQFVFQNFVFAFQLNEMRLNRHKKPPLEVDLRSDLDEQVYMTHAICRQPNETWPSKFW